MKIKGTDIRKELKLTVARLKELDGKTCVVGIQAEAGTNRFGATVSASEDILMRAGIHEHGGVIKPKTAKMLAIPLKHKYKKKSPRSIDGLFLLQTEDNVFLVRDKGKDEIEFCYLLKDSVTMPKRPFISRGYARAAAGELGDFEKEIRAIIGDGAAPKRFLDALGERALHLITRDMGEGVPKVAEFTQSMKDSGQTLVDSGEMHAHITYRWE